MCVTWNCGGSRSKALPLLIRDLVNKHDLDIFVILEPRISGEKALKRIKKTGFQDST